MQLVLLALRASESGNAVIFRLANARLRLGMFKMQDREREKRELVSAGFKKEEKI